MGKLILITGGARSGKSRFAQEAALKAGGEVLFVATAEALDDEMKERIAAHRRSRPAGWRTLEAPINTGSRIRLHAGKAGTIIIDCVTLLVNNIFTQAGSDEPVDVVKVNSLLEKELESILTCVEQLDTVFYVVTNEVGLGVVPDNALARIYRDMLGKANQRLAAAANEVYLLVSGIAVKIK
jgi:adenosylcobinamide kinase / adenosylcobinamide-phosphate guanylyltransferase